MLADLADYSGFYRVTEPPEAAIQFREGKRAVFGRLWHFLNMSDAERRALEAAAKAERVDQPG